MKFKAMLLSPSRPVSFQLMRSPSNAFSFQRTLLPARSPSSAFSFQSILLSMRSPCNEFSFHAFSLSFYAFSFQFRCVLLPARSPLCLVLSMRSSSNAFFFQFHCFLLPRRFRLEASSFKVKAFSLKNLLFQRRSPWSSTLQVYFKVIFKVSGSTFKVSGLQSPNRHHPSFIIHHPSSIIRHWTIIHHSSSS